MKLAAIIALYLIAFGTIGMAYEQYRANTGIFMPYPTPEPTPRNF